MLFSPSYPIAQMDLSQIKDAALGPYRWSKALERHQKSPHSEMQGMPIFPILKHVHRSVIDSTIPVEHEKEPFLVPGGRFLIVTSHNMLQIMDLGVPGLPPLTPPNVICKVDLTEDWNDLAFCSIAVQETKAGMLRVAVMVKGIGIVCASFQVIVCARNADTPITQWREGVRFLPVGNQYLLGASWTPLYEGAVRLGR
jgi:hypothetical protein